MNFKDEVRKNLGFKLNLSEAESYEDENTKQKINLIKQKAESISKDSATKFSYFLSFGEDEEFMRSFENIYMFYKDKDFLDAGVDVGTILERAKIAEQLYKKCIDLVKNNYKLFEQTEKALNNFVGSFEEKE